MHIFAIIAVFAATTQALPAGLSVLQDRVFNKSPWIRTYLGPSTTCDQQNDNTTQVRATLVPPSMEDTPGQCMPFPRGSQSNIQIFYGSGMDKVSGVMVFFDDKCEQLAEEFFKERNSKYSCIDQSGNNEIWGSAHAMLMPDGV